MNPAEFDKQSPIKIKRWVDIDSEEAKALDNDRALTKKMLKIGFEEKFMTLDSLGRIWGINKENNIYYPFHFENGNDLIGYRIAKKAAN